MGKLELEVKVLNIDKKKFTQKLESLGAKCLGEVKQVLYTYDLPTIYGRFVDLVTQINTAKQKIQYDAALSKLKLFFFEVDNLLKEEEKDLLEDILHERKLMTILDRDDVKAVLNDKALEQFFQKFYNNDKKWIRLRQTNDKTTLAVKHILAADETNLQQMLETEMEVPNLEIANSMLEALGFSYKSYQEKIRVRYLLDQYEIDIDSWPNIPTYFEVEGKDEHSLEQILQKLGYNLEDAVSCTADEVYRMYGKSMFDERELKFEEEKV